MSINNIHLTWLILLSLGLHVLVIALWQWDKPLEVSTQASSAPLVLSMLAEPSVPAKKVARQQAADKTAKSTTNSKTASKSAKRDTKTAATKTKKRLPPKKTVARPQTSAAKHVLPFSTPKPKTESVKQQSLTASTKEALTTTTANTAAKHHAEQQVINERIQKQLKLRIAFNHHYPNIAVRNAWEGQVNLKIRVLASGELSNVHIVNSSGYRILDKAALKSVQRVAALPQARQWLQGRNIDVILPIIYKLTDS